MLRSRVTYGHTGLVLNEHLAESRVLPGHGLGAFVLGVDLLGGPTTLIVDNPPSENVLLVQDTIVLDRLVVRPQFRDLAEPLHLAQGGTGGRVHKGMLAMQVQGRIEVPDASQVASLEDRERALRLAFDPYECYRDSPSTDGVYPLSWLSPTTDTANYPTGWMPVTRYARPTAQPESVALLTDHAYRSWTLGLLAPDPRLYDTALGSLLASAAGPASIVNRGSVAGPLRVTITMSGVGATNFTITRDGVSFILNLASCVNGDVVVVTMETCGPFGDGKTITKNGVAAFGLKTSAPSTWLDVPAGTTDFTHANSTGVASVLYEWAHARP